MRNPNPAHSRGGDNTREIREVSQGQNFTAVWLGARGLCLQEPDLLPRVLYRDMSHSLENQGQQDLLENLMLHRILGCQQQRKEREWLRRTRSLFLDGLGAGSSIPGFIDAGWQLRGYYSSSQPAVIFEFSFSFVFFSLNGAPVPLSCCDWVARPSIKWHFLIYFLPPYFVFQDKVAVC